MNITNAIAIAAKAAPLVAIITANAAASKEAADAATDRKGTLAEAIREFAAVTHSEGVSSEDAVAGFKLAATAAEVKAGTIKGYGASIQGFRAMLADGKPIDEVNVKEAQEYVASDAVKELNKARDRLRAAMKDRKVWTAERVNALADYAEAMLAEAKGESQPAAEETAEVIAEATAQAA